MKQKCIRSQTKAFTKVIKGHPLNLPTISAHYSALFERWIVLDCWALLFATWHFGTRLCPLVDKKLEYMWSFWIFQLLYAGQLPSLNFHRACSCPQVADDTSLDEVRSRKNGNKYACNKLVSIFFLSYHSVGRRSITDTFQRVDPGHVKQHRGFDVGQEILLTRVLVSNKSYKFCHDQPDKIELATELPKVGWITRRVLFRCVQLTQFQRVAEPSPYVHESWWLLNFFKDPAFGYPFAFLRVIRTNSECCCLGLRCLWGARVRTIDNNSIRKLCRDLGQQRERKDS